MKITTFGLTALGLCSTVVSGCASRAADDTQSTSADALRSTVGFHRFSGSWGANAIAWRDRIVVTDVDSVATYAQDPATTPGIRNGTIGWESSTRGEAFFAKTTGLDFEPVIEHAPRPAPYIRVRAAAAGADTLFVLATENWKTTYLYRYDAIGAAPQTIATMDAYDVSADERYVYTVEPTAQKGTYAIVRREHDGSNALELGTYGEGRSWLGLANAYASTAGYFFGIAKGSHDVLAFGESGSFVVSGNDDGTANLAASDGHLFVANSTGIAHARAGDTALTPLVSRADLGRDAGLSGSVSCGLRAEYGRHGAMTAKDGVVYLICHAISHNEHALLAYDASGRLRARKVLEPDWTPLGQLNVTTNRVCAMQQMRYHSNPKSDELRCFSL